MWPKNCSHFEEPKISFRIHTSSPLYPILSHLNPFHALRLFAYNQLKYYPLIYALVFQLLSSLSILPDFYATFPLRSADVTLSISQTSSISISNVTSVQITNLIIMQVTPTFTYFHPLTSKYSPQQPLLKCPQCTLRVKNRVTNTKYKF